MGASGYRLRLTTNATAFFGLLVVMSAAFAQPCAYAQPSVSRINEALQTISSLKRDGRVGYATVWDGNAFVQCRRLSAGDMRCDAAGIVLQPSIKNVLTPSRLTALASLGWARNADFGNFTQDFPKDVPTSEVADLLLQTLIKSYGAVASRLDLKTAWVADVPCPPRAGFSQNLAGSVNDAIAMRSVVIRTCSYVANSDVAKTNAEPRVATKVSELIEIYGGSFAAEIQRLRSTSTQRAFLVFSADIGYVQCAPEKAPVGIYCEAQSTQSWPALAAVLTPTRIARLKALGYADPGRAPNYWKIYPADRFTDAAIAKDVLTVLYTAYGYTGASPPTLKREQGHASRSYH